MASFAGEPGVSPRPLARARLEAVDDDDSILLPSAINVGLGVWLTLSPMALGYELGDPVGDQMACGAAIAAFALLRALRSARTGLLSWANVALAAIVCATALLGDLSPVAAANRGVSGAVIAALAMMSARMTRG